MKRLIALLFVLAAATGLGQTPAQLLNNAAAFQELSEHDLQIVQTWLVEQVALVSSTPSQLLTSSAAFQALSDHDLQVVQTWLLQQIQSSPAGSGITNNQVLPGIPTSTNGTFVGSFTGNGVGLTNIYGIGPEILINPPHVGTPLTAGEYATNNITVGQMTAWTGAGTTGILRQIWVNPDINGSSGLLTNLGNCRLQIYCDTPGTNPPTAGNLTFDVPIGNLTSSRYRFPTNGDFNIYRSSRFVTSAMQATNHLQFLAGTPIPVVTLRLRINCPFTNSCYVRLFDTRTGTTWSNSSAYIAINYELGALNFPASNYRLRSASFAGNPTGGTETLLCSTVSGPGMLLGIVEGWCNTTNLNDQGSMTEAGGSYLRDAAGNMLFAQSGNDDFFDNTFSMSGQIQLGYDAGTANFWSVNTPNPISKYIIECYRWFSFDSVTWTNGVSLYYKPLVASAGQSIDQVYASLIYYAP